ncbi:MAG: large conductance mechanosensitive channel protein MscL [Lachnospiraceae bacterium]|nr:large conductance mechanosensitive channel protein MscL [Lachnospiraceae bacterium]
MGKLKDVKKDINVEKVKEGSKGFIKEFKAFAMKGNIVDLATGMVIGSAFTSIINSLVKDIITPLIGAITGGLDFSELFISLDGTKYESLAAAQEAGAAILGYGNFITAIINFLIVALVIFIVFKKLLAPKKKEEAPAAPTEKECPYCLSTVKIAATKCPHCTSELN